MLSNFLKRVSTSVKSISAKKYIFVTGNEACDLDSVASATAFAYLRDIESKNREVCYVPICNIPHEDLALRTEVIFCLHNCNIEPLDIPSQTSVRTLLKNFSKSKMELILVDHHELSPTGIFKEIPVVEIVDHHPVDSKYIRPDSCNFFRVERVGSCSSIVTDEIFRRISLELIPLELCKLLLGAILIDTIGLSEKGKQLERSTDLDFEAATSLESISQDIYSDKESRQSFYENVFDAKFCIAELTLWDLLRRDMKLVGSSISRTPEIACSTISGMDYKELTFRPDFTDTAKRFCIEKGVKILVCITVGRSSHSIGASNSRREIPALGFTMYVLNGSHAAGEELVSFLEAGPNILQLRPCPRTAQEDFVYNATIGNPSVTRKQILPLLETFLSPA